MLVSEVRTRQYEAITSVQSKSETYQFDAHHLLRSLRGLHEQVAIDLVGQERVRLVAGEYELCPIFSGFVTG
jgi:hypothetical protein